MYMCGMCLTNTHWKFEINIKNIISFYEKMGLLAKIICGTEHTNMIQYNNHYPVTF